jgi:HD superfamily phosphodiesterase
MRPIDAADIDGPETPVAHAALDICSRISPDWLVAHCHRTYAYALMFTRGRPFNSERLFVACMLHDVGLTQAFETRSDSAVAPSHERKDAPCFAVRGAEFAYRFAGTHGWPSSARDRLAEAVSLHLNVFARSRYGVEAETLSAASAFDAIA